MDPGLLLAILLMLGSLAARNWSDIAAAWRRHQQRRGWQDAIKLCGLEVGETGWLPPLRARAGRVEMRINTAGGEGQYTLVVMVVPGPPDFKKVRIRPEAPDTSQWVREIQTGDAELDRELFVEGPAPLVHALLDAQTRHLLRSVSSESRLEISLGEIRAVTSHRKLPDILPHLLEVGQRMAQPMDVWQRVAENANRDPEPDVRLQNLLLLVQELPGHPVTVESLRTACSDASPKIRLRAAEELGVEGRPILMEFAENRVDDVLSAGAVLILARELPFERTRAVLDDALLGRRFRTAHACLGVLGNSGDTRAVDTLAKVMAQGQGELAVAAAQALETTTGDPAAEPPLILALQREHVDLRLAAAKALGRIGSVDAVLPLKEAAESFSRGPELRQAARQAVAEIQSRLEGASPGQLSLAQAETGQLSLAQAETGHLSLATNTGGQLSLGDSEKGREL